MTCLKNLCTYALRGCGHTAVPGQTPCFATVWVTFRGAVPCPAMLSDTLRLPFYLAGALSFNVRALTFNPEKFFYYRASWHGSKFLCFSSRNGASEYSSQYPAPET